LDVAFAEINGLMAGLHYQDEAEPTFLDDHPSYPATILDEDLGLPPVDGTVTEDYPSVAESVQDIEHQPMASQWAAIRGLREETAFHHKRFKQLAPTLGDPAVAKLLDLYPDAQSIRNKGAQLVKDVLEGFQPRELSLVFAFASFAYAISKLLYKQGRIDESEILADLKTWRDMIADPRERDTFDLIAQNLWPEAKDHLRSIPTTPCVFDNYPVLDPMTGDGNPPGARGAAHAAPDFPSPLPAEARVGGARVSSDHVPYLDTAGNDLNDYFGFNLMVRDTVDLMNQSHETFDFAAFGSLNTLCFPPLTSDWPPPTSFLREGGQPRRDRTASHRPPDGLVERELPRLIKPPDKAELDDTGMFLAVLLFLQDIAQLVYTLSGRSIASRRQKLYKAEEAGQRTFYLSARETFFEPRRRCQREPRSPPFLALLSVAEKFTESGLLRTISEIKHYLVSVAAVRPLLAQPFGTARSGAVH
jgi:hypothetical protein